MSTCETVRNFLVDHAEDRLGGEVLKEVLAHLASCGACRTEVRNLKATWELVGRNYPAIEPGKGFEAGLRRKIHPPGARLLRFFAPLAAAAAVLVLVVAVSTKGRPPEIDEAETAFQTLPPADQELLRELARGDQWALAEDVEIAKVLEFLPVPEAGDGEDH